MLDFTNKTIIITGASRGIGEASANYFSNLNANVVLAARSKSKIAEIADKLGKNALAIECNVADPTQVNNLMVKSSKVFGTIDVLINNAGIIDPIQRIEHSDPVAWGQLIDTNLKGLYYGIRYALPFMKSNNGGTILNVGSGAAKTPLEGWSHYCSSKAAVHHLTACLHKEEAENGIRTLTLSPGTVATDMQKIIAKSGINSVSELSWEEHIDAHWPAMALAWMTTSESDGWLGQTVSLRDKKIRELIGLK
ncbi:SDR family oxidoreductase [Amylibacter sp.]|nr:SDR family oxidoreductase [Amylibacter sp.]